MKTPRQSSVGFGRIALFGIVIVLGLGAVRASTSEARRDPGGETLEPVFGPTVDLLGAGDLSGWNAYFQDGGRDASAAWSVDGERLVCVGRPIGYLQTDRLYLDFELELEWRFDPAKGPGNSGVLLRKVDGDRVWPTSMEAQLHSGHAGDIWNIGGFPMTTDAGRTDGRRTVKAQESNERPIGEWNRYRIRLDRGELTLEVNGSVQNRAIDCRQVPGRIALQSEGAYIEFRSIRLRPIVAWRPIEGADDPG